MCLSCIENELKAFARGENLKKWSLKDIVTALSTNGMLHNRLTVIWRFQEIWKRFSDSQPDSGRLLIMLVQNLGYIKNHPLASIIRSGAVEACKNTGRAVLPFLLEMYSKNPWQLYANIIAVSAAIAPDDLKVRKLVEKALDDANPEVRKTAYSSIADNNSKWAAGLMEKLENDPDPCVIKFVKNSNNQDSQTIPGTQKKKPDIMTPIEKLINENYTFENLKAIFPLYLVNLVDDKRIKIKKLLTSNITNKFKLIKLFSKIFIDKKYFQIFMDSLPKDVKEILNILVWEGGLHNIETFKNRFGSEIVIEGKQNSYCSSSKINPPYLIFNVLANRNYQAYDPSRNPYYLGLDDKIRDLFKKYLDKPADYNFSPVQKINDTRFIFQDQGQIISQIVLFYTYIQQGNLKMSKNGNKILSTSIKQMCSYCNIKEFYENQDQTLRHIRTQMLADLILDIKNEEYTEPVGLLKIIADELFSSQSSGQYILRELLYHIKGLRYTNPGYGLIFEKNEQKVRLAMLNLIKKMPVSQWISAEKILKYCSYRSNDFEIISREFAAEYLYYCRSIGRDYQWIRESVYYDKYTDIILIPFIKTFMFLCAGIGILDIAYDLPENKKYQEKQNPYLSVFDSLKYIRLTSLGAYLLGLSKDYDLNLEIKEAEIALDDQRLIINLDRQDTLKSLFLDSIADRITDTCFTVNYNSFLKSCASKEDIKQKIRMFRENISSNPPKIWKEFINEIMNKINPMTEEKSMKVYKLKQNDELISLIAQDEFLKKYILKAEDFHIIIDSNNLKQVKSRLEEFGYLLDKI